MAFAICDDVAKLIRRCDDSSFGDERWSAEMAALGGLTVTLRAVFMEDGIRSQGRVSRGALSEGCSEYREQRIHGDNESECSQVEPRQGVFDTLS